MSQGSRAIRLSRIHAIHWYGYQDTLPVIGNLVLAGVNESGKSILMDLLMLVLVGPEKARHHFNRSATGTQSDRTIKGYCLLDTKREENGQPQYFHDKGVTSYVAAEFTWPDNGRVETWGMRIEFRNASEHDGTITPFFCPSSLEKHDFLAISPQDGQRRTLELPGFRALVEALGGRTFASSREYLRDMANASHLNFHREVLDRLLPSAMSFTNLKSFDDFCRRFVLPGEALAVDDVVASYRDFESYERELRELRGQLDRLLRIRAHAKKLHGAERDLVVARYLSAELTHEHARAQADVMDKRLAELRDAHAGEEQRLKDLEDLITRGRERREQLLALLNESSEGRLYRELAGQIRTLEIEIERLRDMSSKLEHKLAQRIKSAKSWMDDVRKAPLESPPDCTRLDEAIRLLEGCETDHTTNALAHLADQANQACQLLRKRFAPDAEDLRHLRSDKSDLDRQIDALRRGLPPVPQPLLHALNEQLLPRDGNAAARALRELCEVSDERWRDAVEVAFTEKFAVVVDAAYYDEALVIYHGLKASVTAPGVSESLIHAKRAAKLSPKPLANSLASKIRTSHPVARALVDEWFGQMICAEGLAELEAHPAAILPDGFLIRGPLAKRERHYDGIPFVGEGGLKRQLEIKLAILGEIEAKLRRLEPAEQQINKLISRRDSEIPDHAPVAQDLVRIEALPALQSKHEELFGKLNAIDSDSIRSLDEQAEELKEQLDAWDKEKLAIVRKGSHREIIETERLLAVRREDVSKSENDFSKVKLLADISAHLERYRSWREEMASRFVVPDVMAREFSKAANEADRTAVEAVGDLKASMIDFKMTFQPKFDELPDDGRSTGAYEKLLSKIEDGNIPEYEKKAAQERKRWETLFRTQVLSRMQQALKNVENIIALLNQQLKRPIGHDRYRIERRPNPDFRFYRELIDRNALDDTDNLFAGLNDELKQALNHFLQTLVKQSNSPEAAKLLDYRQYFDYDLLVTDVRDPDGKPVSVDKQSGKMSGGENQSPYFVAILASYLHAYNRHEKRWKEPSLALVPIDEAFSKLSGERIQDCLRAMAELDLQGVFSMSSGNIPFAFSQCDELIVVTKREQRKGTRVGIRNVPSVLYRDSPEGIEWMERHES